VARKPVRYAFKERIDKLRNNEQSASNEPEALQNGCEANLVSLCNGQKGGIVSATKEARKRVRDFAPSSKEQTSRGRAGGARQPSNLPGSPRFLQRYLGNSRLQSIQEGPGGTIQTKLIVSQPNNRYEQKVDQVAGQVMRMPESRLPRQEESGKKSTAYRPRSAAFTRPAARPCHSQRYGIMPWTQFWPGACAHRQ
jgi:hypothetical protein